MADINGQVLDPKVVLKRADHAWTKRVGDDAALPEYIGVLASAVQEHIVSKMVAARADEVVSAELARLWQENAQLADQLGGEQERAQRAEAAIVTLEQGLVEQINSLKAQLANQQGGPADAAAELERLKEELAEARKDTTRRVDRAVEATKTATAALREKVEELKIALASKDGEINAARAERDTALGRARDLEAAIEEPAGHRHTYEWVAPGFMPEPCECGRPYPRAFEVVDEELVDDREAWDVLASDVRHPIVADSGEVAA
ncbi:hypothetical protein [Amycolatopsis sp. NPDC059657]|uniref:hypothetical protein n=1 Tax=Amycolatopsis sp. NPDC059657 TaxID=3346899 RepID=UPI003670416D